MFATTRHKICRSHRFMILGGRTSVYINHRYTSHRKSEFYIRKTQPTVQKNNVISLLTDILTIIKVQKLQYRIFVPNYLEILNN